MTRNPSVSRKPVAPFWKSKKLSQMTPREWERLCARCGRCCLSKVQYSDGEILHTSVACRMMDPKTGMCTSYRKRREKVSDCIKLTWRNVGRIRYLPATCAYRLLSEGKPLPSWHPLVSGTAQSVRKRRISVAGRVILEADGIDPYDYEIDWIPVCPPKPCGK